MASESLEQRSQKAARLWVLKYRISFWLTSVEFSHSVMSNLLRSHGLHDARLPCPSPTPGTCLNSCPSSQWCHPTISSSVIPFSCLQSFPAPGSLHDLHHSSIYSFRTSLDFPPFTAYTSFLFFSQQNPHIHLYFCKKYSLATYVLKLCKAEGGTKAPSTDCLWPIALIFLPPHPKFFLYYSLVLFSLYHLPPSRIFLLVGSLVNCLLSFYKNGSCISLQT